MRYRGRIYRPPSEAHSYILQATIGCSWNKCTYCDMYRDKEFALRPLAEVRQDIAAAGRQLGVAVEKVFVADGDALVMDQARWTVILDDCRRAFPRLRQVSCYAFAGNILEKTPAELARLQKLGLTLLYIGPETGDAVTMKRIAKGATPRDHVAAAERVRDAGMRLSAIFLLGAGGVERSQQHARASAELATAMDPQFLACLTLTIVAGTPLAKLAARGGFAVPDPDLLLAELSAFVGGAEPTDAVFRTNHASNYLAIGGRLPRDRRAILARIDDALDGRTPMTPDWARGL